LKGPLVLLTPRIAVALAMALHELFTNAVKYGALAADGGRVALDWSCTGGARPMLSIAWRETGGPPVSAPARQGFGTLLLERTLAQDLDGEVALEFKPDGLRCTIVAPLGQAGAA
jgi:two-component sensor histidine kinase